MDIVRAKLEKDRRELKEIIRLYETAGGTAALANPDYSFFLSCHRQRLAELESELSGRDLRDVRGFAHKRNS